MSEGVKPPKRFPMLLWGDLVEGRKPVLRRALAGFRAHECMYAWVYLTEYLAHGRLLDSLESMRSDERRELFGSLDGALWQRLDRGRIDPHYQLSKGGFEAVAHMACLAAISAAADPLFVELGSTFFTARTKFEIVDRLASERFADWPRLRPHWLGIDNSLFMHDTTRVLHRDESVQLVDDYRAVPKPGRFAVFLSRFVASYAFPSFAEFAGWLVERFQAALIEDAYSTTARDVPVFNHGQAEVFFSLVALAERLEQAGFELYLLDTYPDFPADSAPCHVIRYLALRRGMLSERYRAYLSGLGLTPPSKPASPASVLEQLNASVTPETWRLVRAAKRESPVWGPTTVAAPVPLVRHAKNFVRRLLGDRRWSRYGMAGPLAEREIDRAVAEEKP